jgi:putative membrane protein
MRHRRKPRILFDIHAFLRAAILSGFTVLLVLLISTQQLSLYINPRFTGLTELTIGLLSTMFGVQMLRIFRPVNVFGYQQIHTHASSWIYIPFFIVLGLAFALPENILNANLVSTKGLNTQISVMTSTQTTAKPPANAIQEMARPLAVELQHSQLIQITDSNYTEVMNELEMFPDDYVGKKISMTGFIFKSPSDANNQFSLVRYVIVCCTADALPYGVLCELDKADTYLEGTWLNVSGVIAKTKYEDKDVPTVKITSLKKVDQPKNPYVFPPAQ